MGKVNYAILFEIKILHDYYLSQADGQSFFELTQDDRETKLQQLSFSIGYDIRKDLFIEPTLGCVQNIKNHRLKFVPTPTGFLLGAEVKKIQNQANQTVQVLTIPYDGATTWDFNITLRNFEFNNFTNYRFRNNLSRHFLFSNLNLDDTKSFPSMSIRVAPFAPGRNYEMGELAMIADSLNQATEETSDEATGWQPIAINHHWATEQDRVLLPKIFVYNFDRTGITTAEFKLQTIDGQTLSTIDTNFPQVRKTLTGTGDLVDVILDFSRFIQQLPVSEIVDGPYLLEITTNINTRVQPLYLSDDLFLANNFGAVTVHSQDTGPGWSILEGGNQLIRLNGSHPTFEIRFKNRSTYWRYRSRSDKALEPEGDAAPFLEPSGNNLTTKVPKSLQRLPTQFENGGGGKVFLPNPGNNRVKPENDGKVYSDIFVSEVEGLIKNKT